MEDFDDPNMPPELRRIWKEGWVNQAISSELGDLPGVGGEPNLDLFDDALSGDYEDLSANIFGDADGERQFSISEHQVPAQL